MRRIPGLGRLVVPQPLPVVMPDDGAAGAALRPVAAGLVLARGERLSVGLRAGQDVVPIGAVAAAVDRRALFRERGLLADLVVGAVQIVDASRDDLALGILPGAGTDAIARVTAQILGSPNTADCGGSAPFPPRNEPLNFRQQLEVIYRDQLRRGTTSTFVYTEGDIVWTQEYLRYRNSGCGQDDAIEKVLRQIDGGGVAPDCTPASSTTTTSISTSSTTSSTTSISSTTTFVSTVFSTSTTSTSIPTRSRATIRWRSA